MFGSTCGIHCDANTYIRVCPVATDCNHRMLAQTFVECKHNTTGGGEPPLARGYARSLVVSGMTATHGALRSNPAHPLTGTRRRSSDGACSNPGEATQSNRSSRNSVANHLDLWHGAQVRTQPSETPRLRCTGLQGCCIGVCGSVMTAGGSKKQKQTQATSAGFRCRQLSVSTSSTYSATPRRTLTGRPTPPT